MRRVEIALFCAACACAPTAIAQIYDKTDTFAPGKKYTCVPTPDHKGWDCNEAGKAVEIKPKESETRSAATPPQAGSTPPPPQPSRSTLPSYLTSAAANNTAPMEEPPSTVSAAAARANAPLPTAPPSPPEPAPAAAATKTVPLKPAARQPSASPPPRPPMKPPVSPRATHPPVVDTSSSADFMSLPGDRFVVEMARAASRSELDSVRSSTHVPNGDLYEVHLRQNSADAWLLLWGSFDTLEAARAARGKLTGGAPGWPRRVAPLQAEARRVSP